MVRSMAQGTVFHLRWVFVLEPPIFVPDQVSAARWRDSVRAGPSCLPHDQEPQMTNVSVAWKGQPSVAKSGISADTQSTTLTNNDPETTTGKLPTADLRPPCADKTHINRELIENASAAWPPSQWRRSPPFWTDLGLVCVYTGFQQAHDTLKLLSRAHGEQLSACRSWDMDRPSLPGIMLLERMGEWVGVWVCVCYGPGRCLALPKRMSDVSFENRRRRMVDYYGRMEWPRLTGVQYTAYNQSMSTSLLRGRVSAWP